MYICFSVESQVELLSEQNWLCGLRSCLFPVMFWELLICFTSFHVFPPWFQGRTSYFTVSLFPFSWFSLLFVLFLSCLPSFVDWCWRSASPFLFASFEIFPIICNSWASDVKTSPPSSCRNFFVTNLPPQTWVTLQNWCALKLSCWRIYVECFVQWIRSKRVLKHEWTSAVRVYIESLAQV